MWHHFAIGGLGDMGATLVSHPADVLKVRLQLLGEGNANKPKVRLNDYVETARRLAMTEGVRKGLYGGLSASLFRHSIFSTIRHGGFKYIEDCSGGLNALQRLGVAMCTGAVAGAIANPTDVVMIRMQADNSRPPAERRNYRHIFHGLATVAREEGPSALWRGASATVSRAVLVTASQISAFSAAKPFIETSLGLQGFPLQLSAAMVSGLTACLVTCPVDVVKTRIMQSTASGAGNKYSSPMDCVVQTFRTEGAFGFYKGLTATMLRLFPHTVALWLMQEQVSNALNQFSR